MTVHCLTAMPPSRCGTMPSGPSYAELLAKEMKKEEEKAEEAEEAEEEGGHERREYEGG